jgi:His-Xaa-Ser system radical SAM maturase HxsC
MHNRLLYKIINKHDEIVQVCDAQGKVINLELPDNKLHIGDIIEYQENNTIRTLYQTETKESTLFITNKCNSNCIMCPDSELLRQKEDVYEYEKLYNLISLLPEDLRWLGVTGGEPTIIGKDLVKLLDYSFTRFFQLNIMLLTNGRTFSDANYSILFKHLSNKSLVIEIPIHGHTKEIHDIITQAPGSFEQTVRGIHNLLFIGVEVHIRIVVSKLNIVYLNDIVEYISTNFSKIEVVNIIGLEMLGNAYKNREKVWIDYNNQKPYIENCIIKCFEHGILPKIYNFPLCLIEKKYWSNYYRSITESKVHYATACSTCIYKQDCGGFFSSTMNVMSFVPGMSE